MNLINYGFIPTMLPQNTSGTPARVTAVHKERYELVTEYGYTHGRLKSSVYYFGALDPFPTVGDFVLLDFNSSGDSQIIKTLNRKSFFSRRDPIPGHGEQAVAANFDYVFILQSLNHDFNLKRLERYLTLAWQSGAVPAVLLTKADLVQDYSAQVQAVEKIAPGVGVMAISAVTGLGLQLPSDYLKPQKTVVFLGSSGVGKSSLVNALANEELMAIGDIREEDSKGRHTTTHRQLIMLKSGVMIIDTPGMRQLGMWDVSAGLGEAFDDVESFLGRCKFSNCRHQSEPGCAIKEAIQRGDLSKNRWESYLKLAKEAEYSADKVNYLHQRQQWAKEITKKSKEIKRNGKYKK